jgi:formylglycine-generating enzyme
MNLNIEDIEHKLRSIVSEQLGIPAKKILRTSRLIEDLHCDSLCLMELLLESEQEFDVKIPDEPPNNVYKSVFTRTPFRFCDLAELIYLQQGTSKPAKKYWRRAPHEPAQINSVECGKRIPFTQLGGKWLGENFANGKPLLEVIDSDNEATTKMYRRASDGMRCIFIRGAKVEIGSQNLSALPDERPLHEVELDDFIIDAETVSTTAYCRFLNSIVPTSEALDDWFQLKQDDSRRKHIPIRQYEGRWQPFPGVEHWPMVLVSWYGANAYSLWTNGLDWIDYREHEGFLPSEAQWEYAARGATSTQTPSQPDQDGGTTSQQNLNFGKHARGLQYELNNLPLINVHAEFGMSPFGLHHMAGNVWQWCRDWYDEKFYEAADASERNPVCRRASGIRSERGGSWIGPASLCRSSYRRGRPPTAKGRCLGFRCVSNKPLGDS